MTLRQNDPARNPFPGEDPPSPLLSTRALVLLLAAALCGFIAMTSPQWAIGIGTAVVVLTLLNGVVGG